MIVLTPVWIRTGVRMALRRLKVLYCLVILFVSLILASLAGWVGQVAAVLLLGSALPGWQLIGRTWKAATLRDVATQAQIIADQRAPEPPEVPRQD